MSRILDNKFINVDYIHYVHVYVCSFECEISLDQCLLSRCQYCVCSQSIQAPTSPVPSQAHPSVCGKTSHSASLAQSQYGSSG